MLSVSHNMQRKASLSTVYVDALFSYHNTQEVKGHILEQILPQDGLLVDYLILCIVSCILLESSCATLSFDTV